MVQIMQIEVAFALQGKETFQVASLMTMIPSLLGPICCSTTCWKSMKPRPRSQPAFYM